jgi:hypothetical protein
MAGKFWDAIPHVADGCFSTEWQASFPDRIGQKYPEVKGIEKPNNAAMTFAIERLGLDFLLALTEGRSPYRSL